MIMNLESFHVQVKSIGMFLRDHLLKSVYITFKMALKNTSLKSFFFFFFFFFSAVSWTLLLYSVFHVIFKISVRKYN